MISDSDFQQKYESQIRRRILGSPAGFDIVQTKELIRYASSVRSARSNCVVYSDFRDDIDKKIASQIEFFRSRDSEFTWQVYESDHPSDLAERLLCHGMIEDSTEFLLGIDLHAHSFEPHVKVNPVQNLDDFVLLEDLFSEVWDHGHAWAREVVKQALDKQSKNFHVFAYIDEGRAVSAGWMRFHEGTDFASLWGGMTLPSFRGQGLYTELVKARCELAKSFGFKYMAVGAWATSRPALLRLGFTQHTKITNFVAKYDRSRS